jgi:hypothetical protein
MKTIVKILIATATLGATALLVAQDNQQPGDGGQGGPGGPGGPRGHRPPPIAIINALDANHDGIIDALEIANASAALKTLDKNNDGQLTPDEVIGPRPGGRGGHRPPGPDGGPNDGSQQPPNQ